jgi:hypothetical protein
MPSIQARQPIQEGKSGVFYQKDSRGMLAVRFSESPISEL